MGSAFLAACVQLTSRADVTENLDKCAGLTREAAARGARLVVLPENFAFMGAHEDEKLAIAEVLAEGGPIVGALAAMAREAGVWLIGGGMPEVAAPGPEGAARVHNTCVVLDPEGRLAAAYRKIHLFDVQIPGLAEFRESRTVAPGDTPVIVETALAPIGLSICYDLRFPELYRELAARGARVVVVPAAFTMHTGKDHWHTLLRARAIEDQVYVVAAAQFGSSSAKRTCFGHSLIVDPWGAVLADAPDRECVILAELDAGYQDKVRRELPALDHRRL